MDLFRELKKIENVEKVSNFYPLVSENPLNFFFFICPKISGSGYILNRNKTGFTARYVEEQGKNTFQKIERVKKFLKKFKNTEISFTCTCVLSGADALILFSVPVKPPIADLKIEGISMISNYELVKNDISRFWKLYQTKPWERIPEKIRREDYCRLQEILKYANAPENLIRDFVERVWSGFALDGILARKGKFGGSNPVLLGVEGAGVAILQNAALPKEKWLPVVVLK